MFANILSPLFEYLNFNTSTIRSRSFQLGKTEAISFATDEDAARFIQQFWRLVRIKRKLTGAPYDGYVSLIDLNEPLGTLSVRMLGQRQSDVLSQNTLIQNPFKALTSYHRTTITKEETEAIIENHQLIPGSFFLPLVACETLPLTELMHNFLSTLIPYVQVSTYKDNPLVFIHYTPYLPLNNSKNFRIESIIRASGLIASPWEIACAKWPVSFEQPNYLRPFALPNPTIHPGTITRLHRLANNPTAPTRKLAEAIQCLLLDLPPLTHLALDRINNILNIMTLFYAYDYSQFAQHLYYIIHELSLALVNNTNKTFLSKQFEVFQNTSYEMLITSLGLHKESLTEHQFTCAPALSGSHAHIMALKLAMSLLPLNNNGIYFEHDKNYFEFHQFYYSNNTPQANIFCLTTGPISFERTIPGVDINRFVKNHIGNNRKIPAILLIDITTTLYKNLKLSRKTRALFNTGKLGLVLYESNQKFGLLHSDQAQCGRVMALCSKKTFFTDVFNEFKSHVEKDYYEHIDLRINVYIRSRCESILESIKQQHFIQGASLRAFMEHFNILCDPLLASPDNYSTNKELYFCTINHNQSAIFQDLLPGRNSFGHFDTTITGTRISANASDQIDSWLEITKIFLYYFAYTENTEQLLAFLLGTLADKRLLSMSEQIIYISMAANLIQENNELLKENLFFLVWIKELLQLCSALKTRPIYIFIQNCYLNAQKEIKSTITPKEWMRFIDLFHFLLNQNLNYTNPSYNWIKKSQIYLLSASFIDVLLNFYFLAANPKIFIQNSCTHFNVSLKELESHLMQRQALKEAFDNHDSVTHQLLGQLKIPNVFLDNKLITPLYLCIVNNKSRWAVQILKNKGMIYTLFAPHESILMAAAQKGQTQVLHALLDEMSLHSKSVIRNQINIDDEQGWSPLHWTAFHSDIITCRRLIQFNATIFTLTNDEEINLYLTTSYALRKLFEEYGIIKKILLEAFNAPEKFTTVLSFYNLSYYLADQPDLVLERYQSAMDQLKNFYAYTKEPAQNNLSFAYSGFEVFLNKIQQQGKKVQHSISAERYRLFNASLNQIENHSLRLPNINHTSINIDDAPSYTRAC